MILLSAHIDILRARESYNVVACSLWIEVTVTREGWQMAMDRHASAGSFASPDAPFSQRMTYTFKDEDRVMSGKAVLSYDNVNWDDDLEITYRRVL